MKYPKIVRLGLETFHVIAAIRDIYYFRFPGKDFACVNDLFRFGHSRLLIYLLTNHIG